MVGGWHGLDRCNPDGGKAGDLAGLHGHWVEVGVMLDRASQKIANPHAHRRKIAGREGLEEHILLVDRLAGQSCLGLGA
jgi:hypothetical protein